MLQSHYLNEYFHVTKNKKKQGGVEIIPRTTTTQRTGLSGVNRHVCLHWRNGKLRSDTQPCTLYIWLSLHGCINLCCCSRTCVDGARVPLNWCECISSPKGDRDWGLRVCRGLPPILAQLWRAGFPFFFPLPNKVHPAVRADTRKKTH